MPQQKQFRPPEDLKKGFESHSTEFDALIAPDSSVELLWTGAEWTEGPLYLKREHGVIFSDIPNNRVMLYRLREAKCETFRQPSLFCNGNHLDLNGNVISAEHGSRSVTSTDPQGITTTLVDNYDSQRLNSPNDVVVKSDGTIWFTDPPYGIIDPTQGYPGESELEGNFVFCYDPANAQLRIVASQLDRPNGLAFSPDEKLLYISDTGASASVFRCEVRADNTLSEPKFFVQPDCGKPDGIKVARNGLLFSSAWDGIQLFSTDGELIGKILIPEQRTSNCAFGGINYDHLFMTSTHSLYMVKLNICGLPAR